METSVVSLQAELDKAREKLRGVEETIKKNIGRDINSSPMLRPGFKRGARHLDDDQGGEMGGGGLNKEGRNRITFFGGAGYNNNNNISNNGGGGNHKMSFSINDNSTALGRSRDGGGGGGGGPRGGGGGKQQVPLLPINNRNNNALNNNQRNVWLNNNSLRGRMMDDKGSDERLPVKRRLGEQQAITVFSRLSGPPKDEDFEEESTVKMTSQVIVQDAPSRKEVLAAQSGDNKCKERNKRMFGALLGTLQKFRQEENKLKEKEEKRAQVERKLEEAAQREKEEAKKARHELFLARRHHQLQIKRLEYKLTRIKQLNEWEATKVHLMNFIQTKTHPKIFFLPKVHNSKSQELLAHTRAAINKIIEAKRAEVEKAIEEHMPDISVNQPPEGGGGEAKKEGDNQQQESADNEETNHFTTANKVNEEVGEEGGKVTTAVSQGGGDDDDEPMEEAEERTYKGYNKELDEGDTVAVEVRGTSRRNRRKRSSSSSSGDSDEEEGGEDIKKNSSDREHSEVEEERRHNDEEDEDTTTNKDNKDTDDDDDEQQEEEEEDSSEDEEEEGEIKTPKVDKRKTIPIGAPEEEQKEIGETPASINETSDGGAPSGGHRDNQ